MSLSKMTTGPYHRNEWSIIGAPCNVINTLAAKIISSLSKQLKVSYLNETHDFENETYNKYTPSGPITDTQNFDVGLPRLSHFRKYFDHLDILLLNGNHYKASKQIVIINEKKRISLQKKMDRLTDVKMILVDNSIKDIYPYLSEHLHPLDINLALQVDNIEAICEIIINEYKENIAPICGLVLSGGQSSRMGTDKSKIEYHGKAHSEYTADNISPYVDEVFISVAHDYINHENSKYDLLKDSFCDLGPMGGILSAFRHNPNTAWLTVACDLPYLTKGTISQLITARDPSKLATCYKDPKRNMPEPLLTLWEPCAYPTMLDYLSMGYASPSKILLEHNINLIEIKNPKALINANDPKQKKKALDEIGVSHNERDLNTSYTI